MRVYSASFSEKLERLEIIPFSDIHVGSREFDKQLFLAYRDYVLATDNCFCFFNGDLIDNAIKSSKSDIYRASLSPKEQIKEITDLLKPLATSNKIICILGGNHESRTDREVGLSLGEIIAGHLDVPYFGPEVLLKIRFGRNKHHRPAYYTLYATHGHGGGRMKGGKANNLDRLKNIVQADIYCMGHTHDQMILTGQVYIPDQKNDVIIEKTVTMVNSGSFVKRGDGYAASQCYEPQTRGCPSIFMYANERRVVATMGMI